MVVENPAMKSAHQSYKDARIVIFTRFPVAGRAKTRLIPHLGAVGAADLQRKMTEYTLLQAIRTGVEIEVRYTGGTKDQVSKWLGTELIYTDQGDGDLGERMARAFREHFETGAKRVVVIGCDCPDNRIVNLKDALNLLSRTTCVLGPAVDGGYYLIGMNRFYPEAFTGINWGTTSVLSQTIRKIVNYRLLPVLNDVDEPADIPLNISVIIPVLNEEKTIKDLVHQALDGFNIEIIVVDGGSTDQTKMLASDSGAIVIDSKPGRALQMNIGAQAATGDLLFFLHADSSLPAEWDLHIRRLMKSPDVSLGFFRFAISESFTGKKWVEWGTNIRSRIFRRPYGDQGFFLRKSDFGDMGGYPEVPILEDVMLVKKAKKTGSIRCADIPLATSGRRWKKLGFIKTTLINQAVLLAAQFGFDLEHLSSAYRSGKNPFFIKK
jgi:hypothetical protein